MEEFLIFLLTDAFLAEEHTYLPKFIWRAGTLLSPCNNMIKVQSNPCLKEGSTEDIYAQEHCSSIAPDE